MNMRSLKPDDKFRKKDIVAAISHMEGLSISQAERIVNLVFQNVILGVEQGKMVEIHGFGRFYGSYTAERSGKHPIYHTDMKINENVRMRFDPTRDVKNSLRTKAGYFRELQQVWAARKEENSYKAEALRKYHHERQKQKAE